MRNLEISDKKAEQLDKLETTALGILQDYLGGDREGGDMIKMAMQSLNVVSKNRQTTTARETMRFSMISSLVDDPKVLCKYIATTQPQIGKLLDGQTTLKKPMKRKGARR